MSLAGQLFWVGCFLGFAGLAVALGIVAATFVHKTATRSPYWEGRRGWEQQPRRTSWYTCTTCGETLIPQADLAGHASALHGGRQSFRSMGQMR